MASLTEFLLARIADDEAVARGGSGVPDDDSKGVWLAPVRENLPEGATVLPEGAVLDWEEGRPDLVGTAVTFTQAEKDALDTIGPWTPGVGWDPARVLAECEAKRRVVESATRTAANLDETIPGIGVILGDSAWHLRNIATVYTDHPDYREEWKP